MMSINDMAQLGVIHKPCGRGRGESGWPNVHITTILHKPYLVKLGQNFQKKLSTLFYG